MNMKKIFSTLMVMLLAGCGSNAESLSGNEYKAAGDAGVEITLGFDENGTDFHGQAVNNYFGSYQAKDGKIKFSLAGSTMMAAPEPMMEAETAYFQFLDKAESYSINGNELIISAPEKTMTFEKAGGE